jgi:hypothetical protein
MLTGLGFELGSDKILICELHCTFAAFHMAAPLKVELRRQSLPNVLT